MSRHSRPVYSTDGGRLCPGCHRPVTGCVCKRSPIPVGDGIVRIQRQKQGRGGKEVTVISGIAQNPESLKAIARTLKRRCGVGGAVKDGRIELQGDQRAPAQQFLESEGFKVRLAGG